MDKVKIKVFFIFAQRQLHTVVRKDPAYAMDFNVISGRVTYVWSQN